MVKNQTSLKSEEMANVLALLAARLPRTLRAGDVSPRLTPTEASALAVLVHGGAMNLGALAEHEQVTPASISRTISILEKRGLVSKAKDATDGRGSIILATKLGTRMFKQAHARRLAPLVAWVDQLTVDEQAKLASAAHLLEAAALLESPKY